MGNSLTGNDLTEYGLTGNGSAGNDLTEYGLTGNGSAGNDLTEYGLEVESLSFSYGEREVLHQLSFRVKSGELVCLLGPNGVGKSTLFRTILKMLPGYRGRICIAGEDIETLNVENMAKLAAYIPQSHAPTFNYSVFDMVLMGTTAGTSLLSVPGKEQRKTAQQVLEQMGIAHLKDRGYAQISGGERQLTLIARALAQKAKVLIMDEPTANLDYGNQIRVLEQIRDLTKEKYTIIQATHQPDHAFLFADEVIALKDGSLLAQGTPKEVITQAFIRELYHADVKIESVDNDRTRVCVPVRCL